MSPILQYNCNAMYSTKYLKGGYNGNDFLILNLYLKEKGPTDC